jgi:hypothetical protein
MNPAPLDDRDRTASHPQPTAPERAGQAGVDNVAISARPARSIADDAAAAQLRNRDQPAFA